MSIPLPASRRVIRDLFRKHHFDVLHVQVPYSPLLAGRIIKLAPADTAVVGTFHVAPFSAAVHVANRVLRVLVAGSLPRFDRMVSVSRVAQDFARSTFGIETDIIPNTAQLAGFYAAKPLAQYKNMQTIVFLGRLVERKGCQYLLEAVARLRRAGKLDAARVRVIVCGGGPLDAQLRRFVAEHDMADLVVFAGRVTEADKPRYLASADIVVFPSTGGESFGIVLLEAMAASRGVVLAGDNPGYTAVMEDRPQALFDPTDTAALAGLLEQQLSSPQARASARAWQQAYVRQFDVPQVGARLLKMYEQALHRRAQ
jgi:phosphatidylinositol alpha-mannosyltransferase